MANSLDRYKKLLFNLLPVGKAWLHDTDSQLDKLISGLAVEFCRVEERAKFFVQDVDPFSTNELLDEWETLLGLPDACLGAGDTTTERRAAILTVLSFLGGQSVEFLIATALNLGFVITITEYLPFQVGRSRAGERLTNGPWLFHFTVNGDASAAVLFRVGTSRVGEPLGNPGSNTLECVIDRIKPANTTVDFVYT